MITLFSDKKMEKIKILRVVCTERSALQKTAQLRDVSYVVAVFSNDEEESEE